MKTKLLKSTWYSFLLITGLLISMTSQAQWTQNGNDIDGEAANDLSGWSVSMSDDGNIVAIGAYANASNGANTGQVRVYEFTSGWTQIGTDIDGDAAGDRFGCAVSINSNGTRVAIGANRKGSTTQSGYVRVFENQSNSWVQLGSDIAGDEISDFSGHAVSINNDGTIVAIGAPYNSDNGAKAGKVKVFELQEGDWVQIGDDIVGDAEGDELGYAVSLNGLGNILAIGAPKNDANGENAGQVKVFENQSGAWVQIGDVVNTDINGVAAGDMSGTSVSLNDTGELLAIGAPGNDENGENSGLVRVLAYVEDPNGNHYFILYGFDVEGEAAGDFSGSSVSLSPDGNSLAIGAPYNDGNGENSGQVRMYKYDYFENLWIKQANDINGEAAGDMSGYSVCTSEYGFFVAIGAPHSGGNGVNSGQTRVFGFNTPAPCEAFSVFLKNSYGDPIYNGSLEFREGGGSGWQDATAISNGEFCIDTERSTVGLRMTNGNQVQKVSSVPTNEDFTFQTELVTVELLNEGVPTFGGHVDYTSNGWHAFGITGFEGPGITQKEMLPVQYTFRMKYQGKKENKTELISSSNNYITFNVADLKSGPASGNEAIQLVTYPNPFSGNTAIAFNLEQAEKVNITIFDVSGKQVDELYNGTMEAGKHRLNWDASEIPNGYYVVRFSSNGNVVHRNIVKM